jgi:hypothetical protein
VGVGNDVCALVRDEQVGDGNDVCALVRDEQVGDGNDVSALIRDEQVGDDNDFCALVRDEWDLYKRCLSMKNNNVFSACVAEGRQVMCVPFLRQTRNVMVRRSGEILKMGIWCLYAVGVRVVYVRQLSIYIFEQLVCFG